MGLRLPLDLETYIEEQRKLREAILAASGSTAGDELLIKSLLASNTPLTAWMIYANARYTGGMSLDEIVARFFNCLDDGKTYTTQIAKSDSSGGMNTYSASAGTNSTKLNDNAGLRMVPSTAAAEGVDDYDSIPGFLWLDCTYTINATTLEPHILSIEGVGGGCAYKPTEGFVGCLQGTYYRKVVQDNNYSTFSFAFGQRDAGFIPNCASVKIDGSVRAFGIRPKWLLGYNDAGTKLHNGYGAQPAAGGPARKNYYNLSHNTGHTYMQSTYGTQYGLDSYETLAFALDMCIWKYGVLAPDAIMAGCVSYNYAYTATQSTTSSDRVVISATEAANIIIGSRVSVGTSTSTDRNNAAVYSVHDIATVKDKVAVDSSNVAIVLDTETTFSTTSGTTKLNTQPYLNGWTEQVKGKHDGTPINNTSGMEPFRMQGIQYLSGVYEIIGDTKYYYDGATNFNQYFVRTTAARTADNNVTGYTKVGSFSDNGSAAGDKWPANEEFYEGGFMPTEWGASATTRYRSSIYMPATSTTAAYREVLSCGNLNAGGLAGIVRVHAIYALTYANWNYAARPSGTASNRGEWAA